MDAHLYSVLAFVVLAFVVGVRIGGNLARADRAVKDRIAAFNAANPPKLNHHGDIR